MPERITETLGRIRNELALSGIADVNVEAEIMLREACGINAKKEIILNGGRTLKENQVSFLNSCLAKRKTGYPLAYIFGRTEFFGESFIINKDTLIPRQETELLVEQCLEQINLINGDVRIFEIGAGCGNVSICIAKNAKNTKIISIDISKGAVKTSRRNAARLIEKGKIIFIVADIFDDNFIKKNSRVKYNLIISNPPYVPSRELSGLQKEIHFEPASALDGGKDGLMYYRRIAEAAGELLADGGRILTEIGYNQSKEIKKIYNSAGLEIIKVCKDYSGFDRIILAGKANNG